MEKELYNKILTLCLKSELYREEWADHVISELDFMGEVEVLPNFWNLYHKVQEIGRPGNKNALNSVVAYILGVTSAQPSGKFCFEKRRTYGRDGFPDIDMDFDYVRRPEIIKYIIDKYGSDHVGNIGTVMRLKTKAALRRVIKALDPEDSIVYDSYGNKIKSNDSDNFRLQNEMLNELPDVMKRADGTDIESVEEAYNEFPNFRKYMDAYPDVYAKAKRMEGSIAAFGCLDKGTLVKTEEGWVRIDQLDTSCSVSYLDKDGEIKYTDQYIAHNTGRKLVYKMRLDNGDSIVVTDEHFIFTDYGCISFEEIRKNPKKYKVLSVKE